MTPPGMGTTPQLVSRVETWVGNSRGKGTGMEVGHQEEHHCQWHGRKRKWGCTELQKAKVWPWCWNHLAIGLWASVVSSILLNKTKGLFYRLISRHLLSPVAPISGVRLSLVHPTSLKLALKFLPILCFLFSHLPQKIPLLKGNLDFKAIDLILWLMKVFLLMDVARTRFAFKMLTSQ